MPRTASHSWSDGAAGNTPITAAKLMQMEADLDALYAALDAQQLKVRPLYTFSGSDSTAKFRQALVDFAGASPKFAVSLPAGITLDAGTTPFLIPAGFALIGGEAVETEFGYQTPINVRHTGATTNSTKGVFKTSPRGTNDNGTKGWSMSRLDFEGTSSTKMFVDNPMDASGSIWAYVTLDNVCFDGFQSIATTPMLGCIIKGTTYMNNVGSSTEAPWTIGGSDNNLFTDGGFFECGIVGSGSPAGYTSRAQIPAMLSLATLTKTAFGPLYVTGSPTTPVRLTGGEGGIAFDNLTMEGRPVVTANQLWCAGALARLEGGGAIFRNKWHGFAMRDPQTKAAAGLPLDGGFFHVTAGDHVIDGGTFQPYTAGTYGSYLLPDGSTKGAGVMPPFVWITGGHIRISNINLGPNAAGVKPVVKCSTLAMVDADSSVTVSVI